MKEVALGKNYSLSVVFLNARLSRKLNRQYRGKNKPTDILSFPLGKKSGEIFICPSESKTEAKKFERTFKNFLGFLFIHGLVHLKGFDHGSRMERLERKYRAKFRI